jgi:hypothetical protein
MAQDKAHSLRLAIIGLLFMPLVFAFSAAKINQMHLLTTSLPFTIHNSRILCIVVALLSLISIPFINRYSVKDADKLREQQIDPQLVLILLDVTILLLPVMCVLFLFFLGLPVNDVQFYAYPSFLLMIGLLIWKRRSFWYDYADKAAFRSTTPSTIIDNKKSYTIVLFVLGVLATLFLLLKIVLMINPPQEYAAPLFVNLPWVIIYALLVIGCSVTIMLRLRNSKYAFEITSLTSVIVAYWIPFGTAAYLYWRMKIKPKENPQRVNEN